MLNPCSARSAAAAVFGGDQGLGGGDRRFYVGHISNDRRGLRVRGGLGQIRGRGKEVLGIATMQPTAQLGGYRVVHGLADQVMDECQSSASRHDQPRGDGRVDGVVVCGCPP